MAFDAIVIGTYVSPGVKLGARRVRHRQWESRQDTTAWPRYPTASRSPPSYHSGPKADR